MEIPKFTKEDFLKTTKPYAYLAELKKDPFRHEQALAAIKDNAHAVGVRNFERMYEAFWVEGKMAEENKRVRGCAMDPARAAKIDQTARKVAQLLAESEAAFADVDLIFSRSKIYIVSKV